MPPLNLQAQTFPAIPWFSFAGRGNYIQEVVDSKEFPSLCIQDFNVTNTRLLDAHELVYFNGNYNNDNIKCY